MVSNGEELAENFLAEVMPNHSLTMDDVEQFMTMMEAFEIYKERNDLRQNLWKQDNPGELAGHCISKAKRMCLTAVPGTFEDDALDLVNYSVFFVRQGRNG